ncbi:hypothetical protein HYU16_02570 [Candidatus Woesearchaeota archaeon]|nr:hypothetical protein [Candidatus Woesearchaeota archaeon]
MAISKWVSVMIIALLVLSIGAPMMKLYSGEGDSSDHSPAARGAASVTEDTGAAGATGAVTASLDLPAFATRNAKTMKAYEVAVARKDEFKFLTCHCGCGMHAMSHRGKTIPKMNNLYDCFVQTGGDWEDHAAIDCPYCVDLAVMADDMLNKGYTLKQVRDLIDTKYNSIAPSQRGMDMNPPMPPA